MESSSISWFGRNWDKLGLASDHVELLTQDFYERSTLRAATDLLGKVLVVRSFPHRDWEDSRAGVTVGRIIETEAYFGNDPASHCSRGETDRYKVMFREGGRAYVYFIYGSYEMLNFVTEPAGKPGAVLIRALEPLAGADLMLKRRLPVPKIGSSGKTLSEKELMNGPGKLCRALGIKMSHNGECLWGPSLYVLADGFRPKKISRSPRVGITQAKEKLWRFFLTNHPGVSRAPQNKEAVSLRMSS